MINISAQGAIFQRCALNISVICSRVCNYTFVSTFMYTKLVTNSRAFAIQICQLHRAIFSVFYNISQPNFAVFLMATPYTCNLIPIFNTYEGTKA